MGTFPARLHICRSQTSPSSFLLTAVRGSDFANAGALKDRWRQLCAKCSSGLHLFIAQVLGIHLPESFKWLGQHR